MKGVRGPGADNASDLQSAPFSGQVLVRRGSELLRRGRRAGPCR